MSQYDVYRTMRLKVFPEEEVADYGFSDDEDTVLVYPSAVWLDELNCWRTCIVFTEHRSEQQNYGDVEYCLYNTEFSGGPDDIARGYRLPASADEFADMLEAADVHELEILTYDMLIGPEDDELEYEEDKEDAAKDFVKRKFDTAEERKPITRLIDAVNTLNGFIKSGEMPPEGTTPGSFTDFWNELCNGED